MSSLLPIQSDHRRADIDGLRAVAVLSVLGFHAFPSALHGGFVGVDVFFVISGFLISGILFRAIEAKTFTFRAFYAHRIRRIFPALFMVVAATALLGRILLIPEEWADLGKEVLAGCAFASNFLYASQAGYFDRSAELKPLLHLWSLAIEEQFYLLWPALLFFTRGRRGWGVLLFLACGASFAASIVMTTPGASAAFFSPLTRFWELGLGALLAWLSLGEPSAMVRLLSPERRNALGVVGALLIAVSIGWISRALAFPGWVALLPAGGAAMLIAAGPDALINRRLLAHPWAVAIGAISYPLYLWHWPILSILRSVQHHEPSVMARLSALAMAFVLAWITYRVVEWPLRVRVPLARAAWGALAAMLALGCAQAAAQSGIKKATEARMGTVRIRNQELLKWFENDPACIAEVGLGPESAIAKPSVFCSTSPGSGPYTVAILGDSTANHLFPGMAKLYAARGERVIQIGNGTCSPFRGLVGTFQWNQPCLETNRKMYDFVLSHPEIKTVIWSMAPWDIKNMIIPGIGRGGSVQARFDATAVLVARDLAALTAAGKTVVATFDTPVIGQNLSACLADLTRCTVPPKLVDAMLEPYRSGWHALFARMPEVCVFSQDPLFRLASGDYTITDGGFILFRDDHHLSYLGSDVVANTFAKSKCFH